VIVEILAQVRVLAREPVDVFHETFDLLGDQVKVGAHFIDVVALENAREGLLLNLERSQVLHGTPPSLPELQAASISPYAA
jgi:hypothetical protein